MWFDHFKNDGEAMRMFYGGVFGIFRALKISSHKHNFLRITIADDNEEESEIIAPVSQCSIRFVVFKPQTEKERMEPKVIIGFGAQEPSA